MAIEQQRMQCRLEENSSTVSVAFLGFFCTFLALLIHHKSHCQGELRSLHPFLFQFANMDATATCGPLFSPPCHCHEQALDR